MAEKLSLDNLTLSPVDIYVSISWDKDKVLKVKVDLNQKVSILRKVFSDATGKPIGSILLVSANDGNLSDRLTLKQFGIKKSDQIFAKLDRLYGLKRGPMTVFVRQLNGKSLTLNQLHPSTSVEVFKVLIRQKDGTPEAEQRLLFGGKQLEDTCSLADYNIKNYNTVDMVLRMLGGF